MAVALNIPGSIKTLNAEPLYFYYGPWASLATAKAGVPLGVRYDGLTVQITGSGEYWWLAADLTDTGLIAKTGGGGLTLINGNGTTANGSAADLGGLLTGNVLLQDDVLSTDRYFNIKLGDRAGFTLPYAEFSMSYDGSGDTRSILLEVGNQAQDNLSSILIGAGIDFSATSGINFNSYASFNDTAYFNSEGFALNNFTVRTVTIGSPEPARGFSVKNNASGGADADLGSAIGFAANRVFYDSYAEIIHTTDGAYGDGGGYHGTFIFNDMGNLYSGFPIPGIIYAEFGVNGFLIRQPATGSSGYSTIQSQTSGSNNTLLTIESGENSFSRSGSIEVYSYEGTTTLTATDGVNTSVLTLTKDVIKLLPGSGAPTVGDVWTATNIDGSGEWAAPSGGGSLASLSDVTLSTPLATQFLQYNGADWVNSYFTNPVSIPTIVANAYTLQATDQNKILHINNGSTNCTITLPNGLATNFSCTLIHKGTGGIITLVATTTLESYGTTIEIPQVGATVYHQGSNVWTAIGALGAGGGGSSLTLVNGNGTTVNGTGDGVDVGGTLTNNVFIDGAFNIGFGLSTPITQISTEVESTYELTQNSSFGSGFFRLQSPSAGQATFTGGISDSDFNASFEMFNTGTFMQHTDVGTGNQSAFNLYPTYASLNFNSKQLRFETSGTTLNLGSDATGDTYYRNSSGYLTRLAAGTNGYVLTLASGIPSWAAPSGGGGLTVGTSTITSGTNTKVLYNNSGVLGEYTVSGTGNVALTTSPVFTTPNIGTATGTASGNYSLASGGTATGTNTFAMGSNPFILTSGVTTGTGATAGIQNVFNSLTTGNGLDISSSSVSSGSIVKITGTGTAAASNTQKGLWVDISGANSTSTQTTYGGYFSNTKTGTSATNIAGYFIASGGTNNIAIRTSGGGVGIGINPGAYDLATSGAQGVSITSTTSSTPLYINASGSATGVFEMASLSVRRNRILFTSASTYFETPNIGIGGAATSNTSLDIRGTGTTTNKTLRTANSANTQTFEILDNANINALPLSGSIMTLGGGATASQLRFLEPSGSGTNYSSFSAVAQSADINYSLPPTVGAAGTVLTDVAGNGVLTWAASGGITNGAANTELMMSNGTDAVSSKIFSGSSGNIQLGDATVGSGGAHSYTISAVSGATNTHIELTPGTSGYVKINGANLYTAYPSSGTEVYLSSSFTPGIGQRKTTNNALPLNIYGATGISGSTSGNDVLIFGGSGFASGTTNAGNVSIQSGVPNSGGTEGSVNIQNRSVGKLGFFNTTAIVQPTTGITAATFTANTSLIANDTATFDGYTIGQIVKALRNLGLLT